MVYDKLHDSSPPDTHKLDELYEKVVVGMKSLKSLHQMVKSSDVVGWPVSWWCDRMFVVEGLARSLPVRAEIPK